MARKSFQIFNYILLTLLGVVFVLPYLYIIVGSFTSEAAYLTNGYKLWPQEWSLDAYKKIFTSASDILNAFKNSIIITVGGTLLQLCVTTMTAYALTRKNLKGKKIFMALMMFAMLFSGGLIPSYIWIASTLQLRNTYLAVLLPGSLHIWNCILIMNYLRTIPVELEEAAKMDGCGYWRQFVQIILPLAVPIIATIALYAAVAYWNMWSAPELYFDSNHRHMLPITALLRQMIQQNLNPGGGSVGGVAETVKMATTVLATVPILCVYPFLQRFFMSGLTLGSVKG